MPDLSTNYMGLRLKNPLIVGSSTLTDSLNGIIFAERYGAGAVVLKSLYEEELRNGGGDFGDGFHPEAYAYEMYEADMLYGAASYIELIKEAKSVVSIPIIASINCTTGGAYWEKYAEKLEKAGADAIELNMNFTSFDPNTKAYQILPQYEAVVVAVKKVVNIPVSVKIGPYFSSLPGVAKRLKNAGADGIIFFNRYLQMGIDIEDMMQKPVNIYSTPAETYNVLRWVGIVAPQVDIDICSSTGIHSENEAIQHLMAGAKAFQMVSIIYQRGFQVIPEVLKGISDWMERKEFDSLDQFREYLCTGEMDKRKSFERFYYNQVTRGHFNLDDVLTFGETDLYSTVKEDYGI